MNRAARRPQAPDDRATKPRPESRECQECRRGHMTASQTLAVPPGSYASQVPRHEQFERGHPDAEIIRHVPDRAASLTVSRTPRTTGQGLETSA